MAESQWYTLPDGRRVNIPANATRSQLDGLFRELAQEYPTTIGTYYNSYTSPSQNEDGNIFGEVLEGLKGIPKGYAGTMLSGLGGIAGILTPHKDTYFEREIRKTQDYIQKLGRNDKYADSYIAKLGQGLGSGAAYWSGIGALRPLQMGKYVPQVVKGLSPQAGRAASDLASRMGASGSTAAGTGRFVKGTLDQAAMIAPFSVPIQWGQHASQVADYEERTGEDVSAAKELLGYGMTIPLALTEAIGVGSLGSLAPGAFGKSALKSGLMAGAKMGPKGVPAWKSFAAGALEESAQESVQTIGAAAVAQALYDDEAYENLGAQLWEAATVGGGAGGVMALLLNGYTRRVGGDAFNLNNAAAQRIKRDELRKGGRTEDTTPGIPETRHTKATAGFGLANPNLTEEERIEQAQKRKEYHLDQIAIEQQVNAQEDSEYTVLSPQELEQEAILRVERDLARDQKLYEESQEREEETKTEVGVTFPELDDIGGMPLEEIIQRLEDGEITPEMFEEIWTSDRLSRAGNDKREELREFVIRNSSAHNQYDAGAIAALVFGGHTDLVQDAESSESLFGEGTAEEQWQRAREMLASYLSPELAVKLVGETTEEGIITAPRENLAPSEVNEIIEQANQNIENFDRLAAYDAVYGFQGGVDLYERAHILHQDRRVQWKARDGNLELHIRDESDEKILAKVQQDTLKTVWNDNDKTTFSNAIDELLALKNILLPKRSVVGAGGKASPTFKALVSAVTGREDGNITGLNRAQRKALYGHIFNMPTFSTETLLPDLSPRMYTPQHMSNVIGRLAAIRDIGTIEGSSLKRYQLARDLVNENFSSDQLNQLLRHLQEGKYIENNKGRYKLVENNRSHARGPADIAREEDIKQRAERLRLEEAAEAQRNDTSTKLQSFISDLKQKLEAHMKKRGLSQSGIGHQLSADLDGMWDVVLGENGVVQNPENMQDLLVEFDGPNAKILLNLSAIDPSNMSVDQIVQQFDTKIWKAFEEYGYYFQDEIESMDAQAQNRFVSEGMWQEFDAGPEYQEVTYEDFSKLVVPDATAGDARALFMEDLSKGRVDKTKSAGKVAHLKKGILGYLNNSIEATQDNPLVDVLRIFSAIETGALGLRGPGLSSLDPNAQIRNLTILQGVDPRHLSALKRALETGDTESEEKILDLISNEKEADIRLADAPPRTWDQEIFDEAMYQKELEDTNPGEIPPVGINASETAKESYYRLKRGEKPYVMPQALKEKYRRRISFEPTKKMSELLKKYGHPEISADNRLTSEVVIDNVIDMDGLPGITHDSSLEEVRAAITRQRDIWKEPLPFIKSERKTGIASWNMVHTKALWKHLRDMHAFSGIPIQDQGRIKERLSMELARLADTAPIAALHFRNNAMNLSMSGNALGGTVWVGTIENGYPEFKTFEGDEVTIDEAIAMLPNKQDREYASLYLGALRFLAYENNVIQAESLLEQATQKQEQVRQRLQTVVEGALGKRKKDEILSIEQLQRRITKAVKSGQLPSETTDLMLQELQLAWDSSQQDNIAFFKKNSKRREWKTDYKINADGSLESIPAKDLSPEQQVADAQELVREIESMGANEMFEGGKNIMAFSKAYQNVNENYNLPLLLATEQITPEMAEFLKGQAYAPLFKDIGMMASHPMGSNGLMRTVGLEFTQLKQQSGSVFDNALDTFQELQSIDIVTNIQYSQLAMIRDGLTNVAARRTLNDAQALAKLGQGKHSLFLGTDKKHAGPTVLRVQVKGQEQYHLMADPLMAESVMISGFHAPHLFFKAARFAGRLQRHMIVDFPAFIIDNFVRDQGQFDQLFGGSTGSWTPLGPLIKGIKTANKPDALLESRKLGLVTGGGGAYRLVSDLAEGGSGTAGETGAAIARTLGERLGIKSEKFSRAQVSVDQARQRKRYAELMEEKKATGKFNFDNMTAADRYALIKIYYEHAQQLSESTARKQAADISLARTGGNVAQAMLDGLEVMNFGRHGRSPTINMLTSLIPFMGGGITGLDTYLRGNFGATDAPGAHLVSRTPEEFNRGVRQATWDRGFQVMVATMIYLMLVTGTDAYEEADETKKANNYIIPLPNHKSAALPIAFATGSFYKAIPEMIFRSILEEDYTLKDDVRPGAMKQLQNQFNFHVTPQILRPLWQASRNRNDYTKEKIVPSYMEELDPQFQRNDYTSDSAALLAKTFTWLPDFLGGKQLSSPMKMEFLLRQYLGQAATYGMFALDRTGREITGKNTVGTRYEGMDNFPVIGEFIDDTRKGRRSQETFYDLKDEMDVYTQMVNTLSQQNDPKKLQEYMEKNANLAQYKSIIASYNRYMVRWRTARDNLLKNPNIGDAEKRRILLSMMEERQKTLKGIADVSAGVKGVK